MAMTDNNRSLEAVVKHNKHRKVRNVLVSLAVFAAIFAVGAYFCVTKLFLIKKCEIRGDVPYTADEVMQGVGLSYGMNLYEVDDKSLSANIVYNLPYIDSFRLHRRLPSTLVFDIEPAIPSMYITVDGKMYVLSQSLRVLSETNDIDEIESKRLLSVKIGSVRKCVAGEYLETDGEMNDVVKSIFKCLSDSDLLEDTLELDVSDKFDIKFNYKSSYTVKLGDSKNLDLKIRFMRAIEENLVEGGSGIIDVSDENAKEGIVKSF